MYRPNREAVFLQDLLKDFKGVLISDFYAGYDSLPCEQQKCLDPSHSGHQRRPEAQPLRRGIQGNGGGVRQVAAVHRGYDRQIRAEKTPSAQAQGRGRPLLPRSDPLASTAPSWRTATRSGLPKTRASCSRSSTTTESHGTTILPSMRSRPLLTTVRITDGMLEEEGLSDYLVLLSVYQSCEYRGVSFLKFMLSRERMSKPTASGGQKKTQSHGP